ncbi:MAG: TetR/AcrR family transcriptional regulator [Nannocystaceae bacterium]|nr:TetR/AcrR family transcriptional regulator [bacterium]
MADSPRTRLQTDERRAQLLDLGLRLFSSRAYDEVSIDAIAEEAGVSKGLLYHYFGGKRAYYLATIEYAAGRLLASMDAVPDTLVGPPRATAMLTAYLEFVEDHGAAYGTLLSGGVGSDPEVTGVLETSRRQVAARIMRDAGLQAPRPVFELAVRHYIGGVEAVVLDWHARRQLSREQLLAFLVGQIRATLEVAVTLDPDASVHLEGTPSLVTRPAAEPYSPDR